MAQSSLLFPAEQGTPSSSSVALRPYQQEALAAIHETLQTTTDNGLVSLPTGSGKTIVMARLIADCLTQWPATRVCVLAHRRELLTQTEDKIHRVWPGAPTGIWSAGLKRTDKHAQILIGGIQTVYKHAYKLDPYDLLIIDECHLTPADEETMYGRFLGDCWRMNPNVRIVGFTATPFRLDGGLIYGKGKLFSKLIYEAKIRNLINDGYLCPLVTRAAENSIDLSNVHIRKGEFVEREMEQAAMENVAPAVAEFVQLAHDRKSILVFGCLIEHANAISQLLNEHGVDNRVVIGDTPSEERTRILKDFEAGFLRCVVNVGCLTTGLDVERIDCVCVLRATESTSLWVQMVGRGSRLHRSKSDCLVCDYGGNVLRHGPLDDLVIKSPGKGGGEAPVKICPGCRIALPTSVLVCAECGYQFEARKPNHETQASSMSIVTQETWRERVERVTVSRHCKLKDGFYSYSLKVEYWCKLKRYCEYLCFGREGFPGRKAAEWWVDRKLPFYVSIQSDGSEFTREQLILMSPEDVGEAMLLLDDKCLRYLNSISKELTLRKNGRFDEIVRVTLDFSNVVAYCG